jgi:DNA-binding transcriptional ArsR family regulator
MVERDLQTPPESDPLDPVFLALADATRRRLVHQLAEREQTISELAAPFEISLAAVSKHIQVLEKAGLVRRRVDGRTHYCSLRPEALAGALDWISIYRNFWNQRLDALVATLNPSAADGNDHTS